MTNITFLMPFLNLNDPKNRKLIEKDTYSFKNASLIPPILVMNIIMDYSREVPTKISLRHLILTKWLALKKNDI